MRQFLKYPFQLKWGAVNNFDYNDGAEYPPPPKKKRIKKVEDTIENTGDNLVNKQCKKLKHLLKNNIYTGLSTIYSVHIK